MRDARQDGLVNLVTGLGDDELDLRRHTKREFPRLRSVHEYEAEWQDNGLAQREVSQPAGDIFREGLDVVNITPETIDLSKLKSWLEGDQTPNPDGTIDRKNGILYYAEKLIETGDKVAGAALYVITDDGLDPARPLDWRRIQRIVAFEVLDRSELVPYAYDGMGVEPELYLLADVVAHPKDGKHRPLQPGDVIHRSRLWIHKGIELSRRQERLRNWWGGSVLDINWSARRSVEETLEYASTYADRASWLHYSMAELNELYGQTDDEGNEIGPTLIEKRMRDFRRLARTLGVALTDGGKQSELAADGMTQVGGRNPDKVESVVESTGDLTKIHDMARAYWRGNTKMPKTIADGDQASALRGGKNEGDWQSWEGTIRNLRRIKKVTELINWLLTIIFASREGPTGGLIPTQWEIVWRSLVVPSAIEKAEIAKAQAEADNARIEKGVAKPGEVRQQRLVQGDVEGNLKAEADIEEFDTGLPPAAGRALTPIKPPGSEPIEDQEQAVIADTEPVDLDDDGEPDPIDDLLAKLPDDLMTPDALAEEISRITGLDVTTRKVHALARKYGVRSGRVTSGDKGYSARDIKLALAKANGLEPAAGSENAGG